MPTPIELVMDEVQVKGLRIERLSAQSRRHVFDKRLLLVEGRRCQVIPTRRLHSNAEYPDAEYFPLYLPRINWPDFLIYVSLNDAVPIFHIVPRLKMSKDTGRSPKNLEQYRDAWELLQQGLPTSEKAFEILSWQLQSVKESAENAGLEVELLHRSGRGWPPVIKRRILIAKKKCAVCTASRMSQDPDNARYNDVHFSATQDEWPEFQLCVIKGTGNPCDIFVIPRNHLVTSTGSLDNSVLANYKNAWNLLSESSERIVAMPPIRLKEGKTPPRRKHSLILQETASKAESHNLVVEYCDGDVKPYKGVQGFLYISKKRCQVIQSTVIALKNKQSVLRYLPLNLPSSKWAEFLIIYAGRPDKSGEASFYITPRRELPHRAPRSLSSKWLNQYEGAWNLLA